MKNIMNRKDTLPEGFVVRPPVLDDEKAVNVLLETCEIAEYGQSDIPEDAIRTDWQSPDWNLKTDAWVAIAPNGQLVGYTWTGHRQHSRLFADMWIHPTYHETSVGTHLLRLAEERAYQHIPLARSDARITLNAGCASVDDSTQRLLEQEGYTHVRSHWQMEIEMEEAPPVPQWPEGITLRAFVRGQDEWAVFSMDDEAFQDHWGFMPGVFEDWEHWTVKREGFDPSLWFLAFDGNKLVGGALCTYRKDLAWVDTLAVLRPWRHKGLGMALLYHAFGEFYRRGKRQVGLGVDSQNLTGATRLYERVGMHVAREYKSYEKELRAGVELSTQAIAV